MIRTSGGPLAASKFPSPSMSSLKQWLPICGLDPFKVGYQIITLRFIIVAKLVL